MNCPECDQPLQFEPGWPDSWREPGQPNVWYCPECGWQINDSADVVPRTTEEKSANARLTAAAPELLAACQELVTGIEDLLNRYGHGVSLDTARAAIAKATGDKP